MLKCLFDFIYNAVYQSVCGDPSSIWSKNSSLVNCTLLFLLSFVWNFFLYLLSHRTVDAMIEDDNFIGAKLCCTHRTKIYHKSFASFQDAMCTNTFFNQYKNKFIIRYKKNYLFETRFSEADMNWKTWRKKTEEEYFQNYILIDGRYLVSLSFDRNHFLADFNTEEKWMEEQKRARFHLSWRFWCWCLTKHTHT